MRACVPTMPLLATRRCAGAGRRARHGLGDGGWGGGIVLSRGFLAGRACAKALAVEAIGRAGREGVGGRDVEVIVEGTCALRPLPSCCHMRKAMRSD